MRKREDDYFVHARILCRIIYFTVQPLAAAPSFVHYLLTQAVAATLVLFVVLSLLSLACKPLPCSESG